MDAQVVERTSRALASCTYAFEASAALRSEFGEPQDAAPIVVALAQAMDYHELSPDDAEQRARWGVAFGPMLETTTGVYPQPLSDVPDERLHEWSELAENVDHPLAQARLCDLLWERRYGDAAHTFGRRAHAAYLKLADVPDTPAIQRTDDIVRAIELARALNHKDLLAAAVGVAASVARASLDADDKQPGVTFRLLRALNRLPSSDQPTEMDELIEASIERYAGDPWNFDTATDLALSRAATDSAARKELERRKVDAWATAADEATALIRALHLERAIELARTYGLTERANELRAQLQRTDTTADMKSVSAEVHLPKEDVQRFLDDFTASGDWRSSLARFGAYCPLPRSRDDTAQSVRELMAEHPLQYLVTKVIVDATGLPFRVVSTPEEHFSVAINEHESQAISFWGLFAPQVLDAIAKLGRPSIDDLTEFFASTFVPVPLAERLATALDHWWNGCYEESLFILLPRLEACIRELCRRVGLVIFIEPQGPKPGQLKTLGVLLNDLTGHFDDRRRHYLMQLLAEPGAYNLRNRALHGLLATATAAEAALAVQVACMFTLYDVKDQEADPH